MLIFKSCHQRCSIETCVLKTCAKLTGKHLCQSFFLKKLQAWNFRNIGTAVPGTRNSEPATHTWDPGPEILHLGPFTCDPGPTGPGTQDLYVGPGTWDLPPGTHGPGSGTLHGTRTQYLYVERGTNTSMQTQEPLH